MKKFYVLILLQSSTLHNYYYINKLIENEACIDSVTLSSLIVFSSYLDKSKIDKIMEEEKGSFILEERSKEELTQWNKLTEFQKQRLNKVLGVSEDNISEEDYLNSILDKLAIIPFEQLSKKEQQFLKQKT